MIIYPLTATFACVDWVMSLEPDWYSTMFPVIICIGQILAAFAFAIIVCLAIISKTFRLCPKWPPSQRHFIISAIYYSPLSFFGLT